MSHFFMFFVPYSHIVTPLRMSASLDSTDAKLCSHMLALCIIEYIGADILIFWGS